MAMVFLSDQRATTQHATHSCSEATGTTHDIVMFQSNGQSTKYSS